MIKFHLRHHIRNLLHTTPHTDITLIQTQHQTELECLPRTLFAAIMHASFQHPTEQHLNHYLRPSTPTLNSRAIRIYLHHILMTQTVPLLPPIPLLPTNLAL